MLHYLVLALFHIFTMLALKQTIFFFDIDIGGGISLLVLGVEVDLVHVFYELLLRCLNHLAQDAVKSLFVTFHMLLQQILRVEHLLA